MKKLSENLEQNLNDNVSKQGLEKNLNENFSQSARENLSKKAEAGTNKNSYENLRKSEQMPENLDKNSSEANSSAKNLSQAAPKCKAQNFFKNALELSLQGVAGALIYTGKAGVWLSNVTNCLKDEAQRAELSKINEEQAKFERVACILPERVRAHFRSPKNKARRGGVFSDLSSQKTKFWHAWSGVFL